MERIRQALSHLADNAVQEVGDDEVEGVPIPVATKQMLIRMKDTVRPSDAADVQYLRLRLSQDG